MLGGADDHVVIVEPEADLVAWFDAEVVSQLLGNDNLPVGSDTVSHTGQTTREERPAVRSSLRSSHGSRTATT